jgi:hypothetical protein
MKALDRKTVGTAIGDWRHRRSSVADTCRRPRSGHGVLPAWNREGTPGGATIQVGIVVVTALCRRETKKAQRRRSAGAIGGECL